MIAPVNLQVTLQFMFNNHNPGQTPDFEIGQVKGYIEANLKSELNAYHIVWLCINAQCNIDVTSVLYIAKAELPANIAAQTINTVFNKAVDTSINITDAKFGYGFWQSNQMKVDVIVTY